MRNTKSQQKNSGRGTRITSFSSTNKGQQKFISALTCERFLAKEY